MIQSLTVEVAALQRLTEGEPLLRYEELGLCDGTCGIGTCGLLGIGITCITISCGMGSFVSPE
ncbi:MAG: hypothetical protein ACRDTT_24915 [Pseudonocardiaceae bacterium]